ncbi:MAG: DUF3284 domain-containing protein [Anaerorhabdus sp.]
MKITRTLQITEQEFYDYLENDLIANVAKCTQRTIKPKDVKKGLHYTKHGDDAHNRVDITVLEYTRGKLYKSKIHSMADTITLTFETEEVEKGLEITFHQHIESFENKKQMKLMRHFSEVVYYGRMSDTLYNIQKKIFNIREGIIEKPLPQAKEHKLLKKLFTKKVE